VRLDVRKPLRNTDDTKDTQKQKYDSHFSEGLLVCLANIGDVMRRIFAERASCQSNPRKLEKLSDALADAHATMLHLEGKSHPLEPQLPSYYLRRAVRMAKQRLEEAGGGGGSAGAGLYVRSEAVSLASRLFNLGQWYLDEYERKETYVSYSNQEKKKWVEGGAAALADQAFSECLAIRAASPDTYAHFSYVLALRYLPQQAELRRKVLRRQDERRMSDEELLEPLLLCSHMRSFANTAIRMMASPPVVAGAGGHKKHNAVGRGSFRLSVKALSYATFALGTLDRLWLMWILQTFEFLPVFLLCRVAQLTSSMFPKYKKLIDTNMVRVPGTLTYMLLTGFSFI
jgi:hypothetical protein